MKRSSLHGAISAGDQFLIDVGLLSEKWEMHWHAVVGILAKMSLGETILNVREAAKYVERTGAHYLSRDVATHLDRASGKRSLKLDRSKAPRNVTPRRKKARGGAGRSKPRR